MFDDPFLVVWDAHCSGAVAHDAAFPEVHQLRQTRVFAGGFACKYSEAKSK
jgi:hypothetical protein